VSLSVEQVAELSRMLRVARRTGDPLVRATLMDMLWPHLPELLAIASRAARARSAAPAPTTATSRPPKKRRLVGLGEDDWPRVFELRCRSKRGQRLSRSEAALVEAAYRADPGRYAAMEGAVFDASVPFGSQVRSVALRRGLPWNGDASVPFGSQVRSGDGRKKCQER
jgi:hypothetical protein